MQRFESLQGLRGVACLMVVAYHIARAETGYGLGFSPCKPVLWFGYAGVDLFFVLSGFIIAATCRNDLGRPGKLPSYLFRRVWRIFPTYWVALILSAGVYAVLAPVPLIAPGWPGELLDTVFLLPQSHVPRILPVAWTLTYELMFYIAFASLFLFPRRVAAAVLAGWALAVAAGAVAGHRPHNLYSGLALSPFILEFLGGCLVASRPIQLSGRQAVQMILVALVWCGVGSVAFFDRDSTRLPTDHRARVLVFGVAATLAVLAFTGWERGGARFARTWLSSVGDASYSIYLVHTPLIVLATYLTVLAGMNHSRTVHSAWIVLMLVVSVMPGLLLHRYVESPLLRLGKRPKEPAAAVAASPASTRLGHEILTERLLDNAELAVSCLDLALVDGIAEHQAEIVAPTV